MQAPPYRKLAIATACTGIGLLLVYWLLPYVLPFILAVMFTAIIDRPVDFVERRLRLTRGLAVCIVLLTVVTVVLLVLLIIVTNVTAELQTFYKQLPLYAQHWKTVVNELLAKLQHVATGLPYPIDSVLPGAAENVFMLLNAVTSALLSRIQNMPNVFTTLLVAVVTTYFMSRDKRSLAQISMRFIPTGWHRQLFQLKQLVTDGSLGFVRGMAILFSLTFAFATLSFSLFRIPYAWMLGLLTALFDVLPAVGPSGIYIPIVIQLFISQDVGRALGLMTMWIALLMMRQLVEPKLLGAQLGIHPITMIFSLYTGMKVFGISGLWLGPFLIIGVKAVYTILYPWQKA